MSILNIGSLNIDETYVLHHIVAKGETEAAFEVRHTCGGKGLNQSVALARAGAKVYHAGMTGKDGTFLLDTLADAGADVSLVGTAQCGTGKAIIQLDRDGHNSIILYGGANMSITEEYADYVLSACDADTVLLQNEISCMPYIIDACKKAGKKIILNPSPYNDALQKCDLSAVSLFLVNEVEGQQIAGMAVQDKCSSEAILDSMEKRFPGQEIVLTLGEGGAWYCSGCKRYFAPACHVKAVDTTGAGDTFTGYFICAMEEGKSPEECLRLASKAAGIAVTRKGAAAAVPFRCEVE